VRGTDPIDYAVGEIRSGASSPDGRTTITVNRLGRGVFAGTDRQSAEPARSFPLLVRFDDGSEARAFVDGRNERSTLEFDSRSRAVSATIDPGEVMLLDANRSNNARLVAAPPTDRTGLRLVMNWVIWLQNVMLTYTAIA
jgi:hypothetical protein